jgi:hypothetical protein
MWYTKTPKINCKWHQGTWQSRQFQERVPHIHSKKSGKTVSINFVRTLENIECYSNQANTQTHKKGNLKTVGKCCDICICIYSQSLLSLITDFKTAGNFPGMCLGSLDLEETKALFTKHCIYPNCLGDHWWSNAKCLALFP